MQLNWRMLKSTVLLAVTALIVTACGGGGSADSTSTTLSGVAAAGAPIIGKVTIKDSSSPVKTKIVDIAADGNYLVDVSDMTAPYMVRADGYVGGNEYHLYSAATSDDVGKTINITPLTDLIVKNITGSVVDTYFTGGDFSDLTTSELTAQANELKAKLLPILQAAGVSDSIDLLRSSFSTDHTKLDAALDVLKVTTDTNTGIATITNIITQEQMTSNVNTNTYSDGLTNTDGVAEGMSDIQAISAGFKRFSDLFATTLPNETNATLLSLFDSTTFRQGGQNLASFLSEITTANTTIGISFTNISIKSMDTANGTALVAFDVYQNGMIQRDKDAPDGWYMIKKSDGKWYMQGDQRIANVKIRPRAEYQPFDSNQQIYTGLNINIEDRGGLNITSAVVTGAGITGSVTLVNQINNNWFTIETMNGDNMYRMDDTQISAIADTGEVYTVKLYSGSTLMATYTEKLTKRPYKNSELTVASFPAITSPTLDQMRSFTGGSGTITWTLPSGLTSAWLEINIQDNLGHSARAEYGLLPADRTKAVTLDAVTINNVSFTPTGGWIWLSALDSFGRELALSMWWN